MQAQDFETQTGSVQEAILRASEVINKKKYKLENILSVELKKTPSDARAEIDRSIETLAWHGALDMNSVLIEPLGADGAVRYWEPAGLSVAIIPWNFPILLTVRKVAAALLAGNRVVVLASPEARDSVAAIVALMRDAGVPASLLLLHPDAPEQALPLMLAQSGARRISFTGSTRVGRLIAAQAAEYLVPCVLELGGHAPVLVHNDVDIDTFCDLLVAFKLHFAGQSCAASGRIIVQDQIFDQVVTGLKARLADRRPGRDFAPVLHEGRAAALKGLVKDARQTAQGVWTPDWATSLNDPCAVPPTLVLGPRPEARVLHDEPFGPLLSVQAATTPEEMIAHGNTSDYGLNAYVFANDPSVLARLSSGLHTGTITHNRFAGVDTAIGQAGQRASGYGMEGGCEGIRAFCNPKVIR